MHSFEHSRRRFWTSLLLFGVFVVYVVFMARNLIRGAGIEIVTPTNGSTATTSVVRVEGRVENASHIYLNGTKIFTDENGDFHEVAVIPEGYSIVEIRAVDRFGREKRRLVEVVGKPSTTTLVTPGFPLLPVGTTSSASASSGSTVSTSSTTSTTPSTSSTTKPRQ